MESKMFKRATTVLKEFRQRDTNVWQKSHVK